ncbi:hypothetical protein [uncultured Chryseobacterium sp.]|uniref:hypothetical protein n=1 Tax=uncultured Chryseobacterium sp. TaxID=259322 RepID=UPI0037494CB5
MLTKQLSNIKLSLENLKYLTEEQKELLHELNFIDKNIALKKDIEENYTIQKMIFESFAVANTICPVCGKRK